MPDQKKATPAPQLPTRTSIEMLRKVASDAKKNTPQPDDSDITLPDNWGAGDLIRVGKNRLSRAVFGPPAKPSEKK